MIRMIMMYLGFASLVWAGGQPEVTEKEEKAVITASHTVFEAIFVEQEISYLVDGKQVTKEEALKKEREPIKDVLPNVRIKKEDYIISD